ncbi:MAG: thioredoxin-disulfide reductase [Nitrosopumilaceae archaeon]|nr:thioredoxin-disulfide reductase [Nitrosopumilaceae archaeon]NIT99739.1 thioredoxin-disulfide reductase [Nitrosopumilaceae archaeon]NIU88601.1 thioredoxin-disulfide reductase [Nitrosopumilaceae archaeon]NIV64875.1 thioredoxin-disulfide reductase [Nitrosopumilaceae archaeon]NIX60342.1 thioredoxin-disulfide reductase [Nitrosopumilaceae archaeon]
MMADTSGATLVEKKGDSPKKPDKKTKYDVIIIGAGPAGYTAGIYSARAGWETLLLSGILPGGQLVNTTDVENYPGFEKGIMGPDLMIEMRKQTERMGTTIVDDEAINVDFKHKPFKVLTSSDEFEGRAVIVATGASPRTLGLEGEKTFGGKGLSYCATCDGPFFKNQELIVVGGGDSAMEEGTFLTKFASKVHIIHRRDKLRASQIMQERAFENPKIEFHWNSELKEIKGNEKVQEVVISNNQKNEDTTMKVGGVFVAIGHIPNTKLFENQLEMDENGYIVLKEKMQTSIEGVYAAGDAHDHRYRQAVTAAGFGCMAAIEVDKYLTERGN